MTASVEDVSRLVAESGTGFGITFSAQYGQANQTWFRIHSEKIEIGIFCTIKKIQFKNRKAYGFSESYFKPFMNWECDLEKHSSQHTPEEWQDISCLCRELITLIEQLEPRETVELLESPDTSSEQTLEERVAQLIAGAKFYIGGYSITEGYVQFTTQFERLRVNQSVVQIGYENGNEDEEQSISEFDIDDSWTPEVRKFVRDVSDIYEQYSGATASPESPEDETVTQLRKQVEELQGRLEREGDALSYTEGQLAACEKELKQLKEEHHRLKENFTNYSSVYEHKIGEQNERIGRLVDRLNLYQFSYEWAIREIMEPKKGVTSDS